MSCGFDPSICMGLIFLAIPIGIVLGILIVWRLEKKDEVNKHD